MDVATRFQPRVRAQSYLDRERNAMPDDSGGESSETNTRRKFQRTAPDADSTNTFRKPSMPASATRPAGLEHRPSLSQRRRSTLRENVRVPSGPRDYPTSPGKRIGSTSSTTPGVLPSILDSTNNNNNSRTFLPHTTSDPYFSNPALGHADNARFSFGNSHQQHHSSTDDTDSPTTPAERSSNGFDFVPTMNFDDFQNSIVDPNWTSPLLSEFPAVSGGRALPKEDPQERSSGVMARSNGFASTRPGTLQQEGGGAGGDDRNAGFARTASFRRRLSAAPGSRNVSGQQLGTVKLVDVQQPTQTQSSQSQPNLSLRTRRQSTMPQTSTATAASQALPAAGVGSRPPRKSVGPGLITSMMADRKGSSAQQQTPITPIDAGSKPSLSRTSSLSNRARRTTIQPSASAGADPPRMSTLTATTQSRANKVKSLQPPPRHNTDPDTPGSGRNASKEKQNRAHTPSSSGNKRQSTMSGRASGLGARTISPTDARRLKRMSMMQAPPIPTGLPKGPPTPQEEVAQNPWAKPELPRLTQPSPSLIPVSNRKMSASTPSSARASPDGRYGFPALSAVASNNSGGSGGGIGGVSLSSKSSYQSLFSQSSQSREGSTSRLPTPKPRQQHSRQEREYGEDMHMQGWVPPVPAIPKAYESPKETDQPPFFSGSLKSSQSMHFGEPPPMEGGFDYEGSLLPPPSAPASRGGTGLTPRGSMEQSRPSTDATPRKRSGEYGARPVQQHKRTATVGNANPAQQSNVAGGKNAGTRAQQPDATGRKNNNLQPLRLPPMNLMPINSPTTNKIAGLPRPSQEVDDRSSRDDYMSVQTPEPGPKRNTKTPSTPMTASKATFFSRRHQPDEKGLRSSSSHYALRSAMETGAGMMQFDLSSASDANAVSRFWDDSDGDVQQQQQPVSARTSTGTGTGMPIPNAQQKQQQQQHRSAITPFASGSLPKGSGEFARALRGRASGEYHDEYDLGAYENLLLQNSKPLGPRPRTSGAAIAAVNKPAGSVDSPVVEQPPQLPVPESKKESTGGGLRRKLSLGWRRSSSKAANHPENSKASPQASQQQLPQTENGGLGEREKEKEKTRKLQKRVSEMPPPRLPASATWTGEVSGIGGGGLAPGTVSARPSLESARRKSGMPSQLNGHATSNDDSGEQQQQSSASSNTGGTKTRALHSEQPQPVPLSAGNRASSWAAASSASNLTSSTNSTSARQGPIGKPSVVPPRQHKLTASTISALVKDKDDLAADDEMRRLSQKRKDVDAAARESEALKLRAVARSPQTPERVLQDRNAALNIFERGEVMDYEKDGVFFTGTKGAKKIIGSLSSHSPTSAEAKDAKAGNYGYDDERGDYNIVLGDHLAYRYEVVDVLGKGSFGQVVRCVDHRDGGVVAVKIIRNKKRFHQQALVEVGILGRLGEWDPDGAHATLSITSSFYFRSHLCIVTPCLSINLYEFIRAHNFTGFSLPLIRRFSRQLLACLVLLQSKKIIHCDLKPENILLCEARKADVRVIDFGSSCREEEKVYTYIQSRFYRSPEVILGSSYGLGIDMWSLGCILAELWTGYPLFPGENEQEQLACIMEIFGPPDRHLVERCTRKKLFFDSVGKPRVTVSSKGRRRRPSSKTLQQALKTEDEAFVDFVARCLRWDPERRMKPSEAVGHPFATGLPFHQRPGIPEEARRAARVRSSAAVPTAASAGVAGAAAASSSPVKRKEGNAFALAQQQATTPAKERTRALPETPQTALRNGGTSGNTSGLQGSPSKIMAANRRHSTVATAGAAAVAGSKRASNGAVLSAAAGGLASGQRVGSGVSAGASLAQMAARESMGGQSAARWRT